MSALFAIESNGRSNTIHTMKGSLFLHCSATLLILATGTTLCAADDPVET